MSTTPEVTASSPASLRGFPTQGAVAVITGASSGLGAEFARQLAPDATQIVLAARNQEALSTLAAELQSTHPHLKVTIAVCDLSTTAGRDILWQTVDAMEQKPNLLINNAGLGDYGLFSAASDARILQQIDLNITALTLLARHFLDRVQTSADKPAAILNVSSLASAMPVPDLGVYAATKAYVTSLTEALAVELRSRHIHVMAVCPGPTPTNFGSTAQRKGEKDIDRGGQDLLKIPPQRVVTEALETLRDGGILVYPGKRVAFAALVFRLLPRPLLRFALSTRFNRSLQKNQA